MQGKDVEIQSFFLIELLQVQVRFTFASHFLALSEIRGNKTAFQMLFEKSIAFNLKLKASSVDFEDF